MLKDLVDARGITYGVVQPGKPQDDGTPILRVNNFSSWGLQLDDVMRIDSSIASRFRRSRLSGGEVLITLVGSTGQVAVVPPALEGWNVARAVGVVPVRSDVSSRWVAWCLQAPEARRYVNARLNTTVQATLNLRDLAALSIPIPPATVMSAITSVLGALDDKIASNRRLADATDAVWQTELIHTFRDAPATPVADLIAAGALVVNDGYRARNSELSDAGIPFVRAGNLTVDGLVLDGADLLPPEAVERAGFKVAHPWDTAFTSKGTVGRITLVGPAPEPFVYSPQVCFWRSAQHERLSPLVLHAWMRGASFAEQVGSVKGQTDMADYVSLRDQRAMTLALPSEASQRTAQEIAEPMARMAWNLRRETRTLSAIRDSLLPKLMSGQIRVSPSNDAEDLIGRAHEAGVAA